LLDPASDEFISTSAGVLGPRRRPLLIALAAGVVDAKIVLRVLVEILGGNSIVARRRFPCQGDVTLEYLMRAAADLDFGAVAVECLIVLRNSRRLSGRCYRRSQGRAQREIGGRNSCFGGSYGTPVDSCCAFLSVRRRRLLRLPPVALTAALRSTLLVSPRQY
jgi:hypothetical protein